jgi:hypothetical protein
MQMRWESLDSEVKLFVFCPHGDWTDGATIAYNSGIVGIAITH